MIRIYGIGTTRTLRVHWAMKEAGIEYETVPVEAGSEESESEEYKKINLTSKIPSADFDGYILTESCAIIKYIGNMYNKKLVGKDQKEGSKIDEWLFYLLSEIDSHTLYIINKHAGNLAEIFGKSTVATKTAVNGFNNQIVKLSRGVSGNEFLVGNRFTVVDIMAVTCIISANKMTQYGLVVPESCQQYADNLMKRSHFTDAWRENYGN